MPVAFGVPTTDARGEAGAEAAAAASPQADFGEATAPPHPDLGEATLTALLGLAGADIDQASLAAAESGGPAPATSSPHNAVAGTEVASGPSLASWSLPRSGIGTGSRGLQTITPLGDNTGSRGGEFAMKGGGRSGSSGTFGVAATGITSSCAAKKPSLSVSSLSG